MTAFEEKSFEKQATAAEETSRALQVLNCLFRKNRKRPANPEAENASTRKRPKAALSTEKRLLGIDSGSEHGSNNSQESSCESEDLDVTGIPRPEMADHFDPTSFLHQLPGTPQGRLGREGRTTSLPPLRIQPCSAEVKNTTNVRHRRGEQWGVFNLGPIYSEGVRTGYGAICGWHSNAEDVPSIYCRKALTIGDLSEEDCRVD